MRMSPIEILCNMSTYCGKLIENGLNQFKNQIQSAVPWQLLPRSRAIHTNPITWNPGTNSIALPETQSDFNEKLLFKS